MNRTWLACGLLLVSLTATAAPPKGAYKILTMGDGKQTSVVADLFKKGDSRGEFVVEFDGDTVSIGMWQISKATEAKYPNQVLLSECRGQTSTSPKWSADGFTLASALDLKAWGNAYHVTKTKKRKDTTTRTWNTGADCMFSLSKGSYKIAASGDSLTLTSATTTFQLERTPAVKDVDTAAEAKQLASE
jgi:hypothetical protein